MSSAGKAEYHFEIEQNTPEWDLIRCGMPTASEFSKLLTPAQLKPSKSVDDYALELAASIWAQAPIDTWEGNYWTNRGHELEQEARAWYEMRKNVDVTLVGFIDNSSLMAGCSPDGLIGSVMEENGLLELKNLGAKEHIRTLAAKDLPFKYQPQAHGQLLVSGRAWVDVVFYHPSLPKKIWRVLPDRNIAKLLTDQIKVCNDLVVHYLSVIKEAA